MNDSPPHAQYMRRFRRVLLHIERHLQAELSVEVLSSVASSSAFHFQRQFTALVGVPVSKYVHLRRLHAAVWQLAYRPDVSVLTIALQAGYESPEAFAPLQDIVPSPRVNGHSTAAVARRSSAPPGAS